MADNLPPPPGTIPPGAILTDYVQHEPFKDEPPHVIQAMREEHARFREEYLQMGPHRVPLNSMKPRLQAAKARARAAGPGDGAPE